MINIMEKVIDFLETTLPILLTPIIIVMVVRLVYQILTN